MESWGADLYGDPCRECGFAWRITPDQAVDLVRNIPTTYSRLLEHRTGFERHPDLTWNASAYVSHVTDNLRIWAERLAGARLSRAREVAAYDQDLLAEAKSYNEIDLSGALWSLTDAVNAWLDSVTLARQRDVTLLHASRGIQTVDDVARNNAHDGIHHAWDIQRIVNYVEE